MRPCSSVASTCRPQRERDEGPLEPLPDTLPGYYRFEPDLSMVGGWARTLAVKLPGTDPIHRRLVLQATQ